MKGNFQVAPEKQATLNGNKATKMEAEKLMAQELDGNKPTAHVEVGL